MAAAVAAALALALGASALSVQQAPKAQEESPAGSPRTVDLAGWSEGPKVVEASDLHHAEVQSLMSGRTLGIEAYDPSEDATISGSLLSKRGWETARTAQLCRDYHGNGAVGNFLDVGANIGTFTIPLADCLTGRGRVLAVEGVPPILDHLVMGILGNEIENVDVYGTAVGAPDDPSSVTMSLNPVNKGASTVKGTKKWNELDEDKFWSPETGGPMAQQKWCRPHCKPSPNQREAQKYKKVHVDEFAVPITTGDRMLEHNPAMKAIMMAKIDIEGYEGHFLKGSQVLFSQFPPCSVSIELTPEWLERAGTPVKGILDQLSGWGYVGVPTEAELSVKDNEAKTRTITQKDMKECAQRVASYA